MKTCYSQKILKDEFLKRQRKNSNYSLRAFSRDIGLASPVVSEIFSGKRKVPKNSLAKIADKLCLSPTVKSKFLSTIKLGKNKSLLDQAPINENEYQILTEERNYKIISEWEHYAIFSLMDTEDFKSNEDWIAQRLSISTIRVKTALDNLEQSGLIKKIDNNYVKLVERLTTTFDVPSSALRKAHLEELEIAKTKIEFLNVDQRYFSSSTLAIDQNDLEKVKIMYREFREKLTSVLDSGSKNEVYQFNFQAFPLTKLK